MKGLKVLDPIFKWFFKMMMQKVRLLDHQVHKHSSSCSCRFKATHLIRSWGFCDLTQVILDPSLQSSSIWCCQKVEATSLILMNIINYVWPSDIHPTESGIRRAAAAIIIVTCQDSQCSPNSFGGRHNVGEWTRRLVRTFLITPILRIALINDKCNCCLPISLDFNLLETPPPFLKPPSRQRYQLLLLPLFTIPIAIQNCKDKQNASKKTMTQFKHFQSWWRFCRQEEKPVMRINI